MGVITLQHAPWAALVFLVFATVCGLLIEPRFGKKGTVALSAGLLFAIALIQVGLVLSGCDIMLVLTLLPLTAYLPAVIGVHVLSRTGFFPTLAVWAMGAMAAFVLAFLQKLLMSGALARSLLDNDLAQTACVVLAAVAVVLIVRRYLRVPFRTLVLHGEVGWLPVCLPVALVFLLLSYFESSVSDPTMTVLVFLTALSVFLIVVRVLSASASERSAWEARQEVAAQLDIQRREYEAVLGKMELGRAYRHDMRHHLMVLEGLADEGDDQGIASYLDSLGARFRETERSAFCENAAVNAVLSSFADQVEEAGCALKANVRIPAELPVDELDVCVLLANALENALNACRAAEGSGERTIDVDVVCESENNLCVSVENPCAEQLVFGDDGLPVVAAREGHGIGLKSIKAIVERHRGMLQCSCDEGAFRLRAVLFAAPEPGSPKRAVPPLRRMSYGTQLLACAFALAICLPSVAQAVDEASGEGSLVEVLAERYVGLRWGDTAFSAVVPQVRALVAEESASERAQDAESGEDAERKAFSDAEVVAPEPAGTDASAESEPAAPSQDSTPAAPALDPPASGVISWESTGGGSATDAPAIVPPVVKIPPSQDDPVVVDPSGEADRDVPKVEVPSNPVGNGPAADADRQGQDAEPSPPGRTEEEAEEAVPPPNLEEGVEDINQRMEEYVESMREKFIWYASRAYNGYVGMDVIYEVVRNDDALLSIRFDATLNAGGSGQYSRTFTLDKRSGSVLELKDLFLEGSDYVGAISADVLRQMTEQVQAGQADYFVSGYGWPEESCFKAIDADQHFYIDAEDRLVIVFDKYAVAPGTHGSPEFVVRADALGGVLRSPSLVR